MKWRAPFTLAPGLLALLNFGIVCFVFMLDVRDLWFKTRWLGPEESFSFTAIGTQYLQPQSLVPTMNLTTPQQSMHRLSGWSSFLEKCERLQPISTGPFFLHAMGTNCRLGPHSAPTVVAELMFASSVRVDTVAWAACKLLRPDRRPTICRTRLVQAFTARYNIADTPSLFKYTTRQDDTYVETPTDESADMWTVDVGGAAETELLDFLGVIAQSAPLSKIVCVEGFIHEGPGRYVSSIFGCGSPNKFVSAFVGLHATGMAQFHQNKAWMTSDWVYLLGVPYLIRQNCRSFFHVEILADQTLALEHRTRINFSSSGFLYTMVVFIDTLLLLINLRSTMEISSLVLWPFLHELRAQSRGTPSSSAATRTPATPLELDDYQAVLTCPLFRSTPFALLMLLSQALSWLIVLPNAVIWTWTESTQGKIQAYLSTLRFWVIVLIVVINLWNILVSCSEKHAYWITKRTHVSIMEVFVVASTVAYLRGASVFSIGDKKYAIDGQRVVDFASFVDHIAFANTYPEDQDALQTSSPAILSVIYQPLFEIVAWSIVGVVAIALLRWMWNSLVLHSSRTVVAPSTRHALTPAMPSTAGPSLTTAARGEDGHNGNNNTGPSAEGPAISMLPQKKRYKRLPLEVLLNIPIRARSLIRNGAALETLIQRKIYLRPSAYVEHGIIMEDGKLRTRQGFFNTIRYSTDVGVHSVPSTVSGLSSSSSITSILKPLR